MSFVRPEARAVIRRWREALVGLCLLALGAYWAFGITPGLLRWVGYAALAGGAVLVLIGVQRGRFRQGGGGPGIVQVIERRISYFGPLSGGIVDLESVTSIGYDPTGHPASWVINRSGGEALVIPATAEGADALFDAFTSLPGLGPERLAAVAQREGAHAFVIWRRADEQQRIARLH